MDIAKAKEFIYLRNEIDEENDIVISKDLDKILEITDNSLIGVYGVVDTESGEKLFHTDFAYSGEPILTNVFLHKDYIMHYYEDTKITKL